MKTLVEVTKALQVNQSQIDSLKSAFDTDLKSMMAIREELLFSQKLLLADFDLEKVSITDNILLIQGNVTNSCEGSVIAELAAADIANGCKHLKTKYFGNKRYDGFYQRNDCEYGYGPKHGSIVERVGLRDTKKVLTPEEQEACIYTLLNYKKVINAVKTERI
jgi:hypothetical protein